MTDRERVHCPECGTTVYKDEIADAVEVAEQHNETRHGGERVTEVNGFRPPEFSEEEVGEIQENLERAGVIEDGE